MVEDDIFACASGEIVDGLEDLVGDAVQFESGVQGDDCVVAEGARDAVAVGRGGGESAGINAVRKEPHASLGFQAMQQVGEGAAMHVFPVALAGFPDREQRSVLGVLRERNFRFH